VFTHYSAYAGVYLLEETKDDHNTMAGAFTYTFEKPHSQEAKRNPSPNKLFKKLASKQFLRFASQWGNGKIFISRGNRKKCKKCLESCHQDYEVFFRSKLGPNYLMLVYLQKLRFTSISV
jgi:hypothetical protein